MKAVKITGPAQSELLELPDPQAHEDWVVVKILVAPMCTEYKQWTKGGVGFGLGHEAAGEVVDVARPRSVKVGDRVVVMPLNPCGCCDLCRAGEYIHCQHGRSLKDETGYEGGNGTYAQYILKPHRSLVKIPDDLTSEHASMACCGLGPTFGAMERMQVSAHDTVVICGLGPVGLGAVVNGVFRGATVVGVESHPYRIALAKELGAALVVHPEDAPAAIAELTEGRGADCGIDCAGVPAAQRLLIDGVRRRGQVAFVGEAGELTVNVSQDLIRKGLTLHGQWHYNLALASRMLRMIRAVGGQLDRQISHRYPMSAVQRAFELQAIGQCGKIVLDPWT